MSLEKYIEVNLWAEDMKSKQTVFVFRCQGECRGGGQCRNAVGELGGFCYVHIKSKINTEKKQGDQS